MQHASSVKWEHFSWKRSGCPTVCSAARQKQAAKHGKESREVVFNEDQGSISLLIPYCSLIQISACSSLHVFLAEFPCVSLCRSDRGLFLLSVLSCTASRSPCSEGRSQARLPQNGRSQSKGIHPRLDAHCTVREHWHVHSSPVLWPRPMQTPCSSDETADSESREQANARWWLMSHLEEHHCQLQERETGEIKRRRENQLNIHTKTKKSC